MNPRHETYAERDKRLRKEAEERRKKVPKKVKPLTTRQRQKADRLIELVNEAHRGTKRPANIEIR